MGKQQVASFWAQRCSSSTKQRGEGVRVPTALAGGEMVGLLHPPGYCHSAPRLGQLGSGGSREKKKTKLKQDIPDFASHQNSASPSMARGPCDSPTVPFGGQSPMPYGFPLYWGPSSVLPGGKEKCVHRCLILPPSLTHPVWLGK